LVALYSEDGDDTPIDGDQEMMGGAPMPKIYNKKDYRTAGQAAILDTLQDFASIAKVGKLNNLVIQSFVELVQRKQA